MNYTIMIGLPIFLVLISMIFIQGYLFGTKIKPGNGSHKIIAAIVLIVGILLTLFLSWDLSGTAVCDGNKSICLSKIFNKTLPAEFCEENAQPCECVSDQDCKKIGCSRCINGLCIPFSGTRKKTVIKTRKLNISILVFSIISAILLPMIFYFGIKSIGRKPDNIVLNIIFIVILCVLFPIIDYVQAKTEDIMNPTCD